MTIQNRPSRAIVAFAPRDVLLSNNHLVYHSLGGGQRTLSFHIGKPKNRSHLFFDQSLYIDDEPDTKKTEVNLHQQINDAIADDLGMYLRLDKDGEVLEAICRFGEAVRTETYPINNVQLFFSYGAADPLYCNKDRDLSGDSVLQEIYDQYNARTIWAVGKIYIRSTSMNERFSLVSFDLSRIPRKEIPRRTPRDLFFSHFSVF